jgi:hypothetical protein
MIRAYARVMVHTTWQPCGLVDLNLLVLEDTTKISIRAKRKKAG